MADTRVPGGDGILNHGLIRLGSRDRRPEQLLAANGYVCLRHCRRDPRRTEPGEPACQRHDSQPAPHGETPATEDPTSQRDPTRSTQSSVGFRPPPSETITRARSASLETIRIAAPPICFRPLGPSCAMATDRSRRHVKRPYGLAAVTIAACAGGASS